MGYKNTAEQKRYNQEHYQLNKVEYLRRANERRRHMKTFVLSLKVKCVQCGYNDCKNSLAFHHRKGEDKLDEIADLARRSASRERILKEVAKCEVLCFNCHQQKHCPNEC